MTAWLALSGSAVLIALVLLIRRDARRHGRALERNRAAQEAVRKTRQANEVREKVRREPLGALRRELRARRGQ